ncbi:MAG: hypothetical protein JJP05_08125 [cyanobacterium endosymbiont of Rhopalodia gibba]
MKRFQHILISTKIFAFAHWLFFFPKGSLMVLNWIARNNNSGKISQLCLHRLLN